MGELLEEILAKVRSRITPTTREREKIAFLTEKFKARVKRELERLRLPGRIQVEGSIAKDTWLRGDADLDLFILLPEEIPREALATSYLEAAKRSLRGYKVVGRFAEHPYVEAWITRNMRVNIVPCYDVKPPNWKSSTDRTPYHTQYVKARLSEEAKDEVRLLKKFMKAVEVYGSDIKVGGFSGYLAELLIIAYGDFIGVLRKASEWKHGEILDVENLYGGELEEARSLFGDHCLIVVDPVDKARNVASPLRPESFNQFRAAAKHFLEKPSLKFFYPPKPRPPQPSRLRSLLEARASNLLFLVLGEIKAVPDVLWGQLYKTQRAVERLLEGRGFKVLRSSVWSDERRHSVIVYELESALLPSVKKHLGPPVNSPEEGNFIAKHAGKTVSGPYIEDGRWVVLLKRDHTDARKLLLESLASGGRNLGVASKIAQSIQQKGFKIYVDSEIAGFYRRNQDFQVFLTRFLSGKPPWL